MISVRNGRPGRARLAALGAYAPERVVTNAEIEARVDTTDEWIVSRTGIRERRFAAPEQAASDLAVVAAERILADAGVAAADLDMVIVATATPDHLFPSTAAIVADRIGARSAAAYDLLGRLLGVRLRPGAGGGAGGVGHRQDDPGGGRRGALARHRPGRPRHLHPLRRRGRRCADRLGRPRGHHRLPRIRARRRRLGRRPAQDRGGRQVAFPSRPGRPPRRAASR